jgi:predicted nucleic acid-binding protein
VAERVLIDTSAWIDFFRAAEPVASLVDRSLLEGSAAVCGMVELELRQGIRPEEREAVLSLVSAATRLPTEETDWAQAGDRLANLRRRGVTIPSTDGLIAHLALRHEAALLENDGHFRHFTELVRLREQG